MSIVPGYNPLRWNCKEDGCFNVKRRPAIELFADCFPGNINFSDVDGIVEMRGVVCMLEWKTGTTNIPRGQDIMFRNITEMRFGNVVYVVDGDAETMKVRRFCRYWSGKPTAWENGDLEAVKASLRGWVQFVTSSAPPKEAAA